MENVMKDEGRKMLTEFLGECWHDEKGRYETHVTGGNWAYDHIEHHYAPCCSKCGKKNPKNRTFEAWKDTGALIETIAKSLEADDFALWLSKQGYTMLNINKDNFPFLVLQAIKEWVVQGTSSKASVK